MQTQKRKNQNDYKPKHKSLGNQEKELKHYFHNCVTSSKLETIKLKLLKDLKQEF
jgi:hypothetical protein